MVLQRKKIHWHKTCDCVQKHEQTVYTASVLDQDALRDNNTQKATNLWTWQNNVILPLKTKQKQWRKWKISTALTERRQQNEQFYKQHKSDISK